MTASRAVRGRRVAAAGLLLTGVAIALGSVLPWASYNSLLNSGYERSGVDLGPGTATLGLGIVLAVIGGDATRRGGVTPVWSVALAAALLTLVPVALFVLRSFRESNYRSLGDFMYHVIGFGVGLIVVAAVIATAASIRLRMAGDPSG